VLHGSGSGGGLAVLGPLRIDGGCGLHLHFL
jgi:hypothetical protein